jgi:hypothetical protein
MSHLPYDPIDKSREAMERINEAWEYEAFGDHLTGVLEEFLREAFRAGQATGFDWIAHLRAQRDFSLKTFGPGDRLQGVLAHVRKELTEIEATPTDITEWIDAILLLSDGCYRQGFTPEQMAAALKTKFAKNQARQWPDWRTADPNGPIEHMRAEGEAA